MEPKKRHALKRFYGTDNSECLVNRIQELTDEYLTAAKLLDECQRAWKVARSQDHKAATQWIATKEKAFIEHLHLLESQISAEWRGLCEPKVNAQ